MNRKELLQALTNLGDGIHQLRSNGVLYQGIVKKNGSAIIYVDGGGSVYEVFETLRDGERYRDVGQLTDPVHFKIIAAFNNWI